MGTPLKVLIALIGLLIAGFMLYAPPLYMHKYHPEVSPRDFFPIEIAIVVFGGTGVLIGVSLTILWTFRPIIKLFRKMPMDRGDVVFILHMPVEKRLVCNDIHFMTGELGAERRCQLPKPARGAEASTAAFMPRGAAQAELTEGAERSLEFAGK